MDTIKIVVACTALIINISTPLVFASTHTYICNTGGKCTGSLIRGSANHVALAALSDTLIEAECSPWSNNPPYITSANVHPSSTEVICWGWYYGPPYSHNQTVENCSNMSAWTHYLTVTEINCGI